MSRIGKKAVPVPAGVTATIDAGVTYLVTENIQLDAGCNFGVTPAADAVNPFIGLSIRL